MKILGRILMGIGIFLAVMLCIGIYYKFTGSTLLKDAVLVEDGRVYEENEGKIVVVTGSLTKDADAYDLELGLELHTPYAVKSVYDLQKFDEYQTEQEKKKNHNRNLYYLNWTGIPDKINVYGKASVGEFYLSREMLEHLNTGKEYTGFDMDVLNAKGLYYVKGKTSTVSLSNSLNYIDSNTTYTSKELERIPYKAILGYSYAAVDPEEYTEITLCGRQTDGALVYEALGIPPVLNHKVSSVSEFTGEGNEGELRSGIILLAITLAFLCGGFDLIRKANE